MVIKIYGFCMRVSALLIFVLTVSSPLSAQVIEEWVIRENGRGNGPDYAKDIVIDQDGNIIVTGYCDRSLHPDWVDYDFATAKYDNSGNTIWIARYPGLVDENDKAYALALDEAGNVYVTGAGSGHADDYTTIKYNSDGVQQWMAQYTSPGNYYDKPNAIAVDSEGNVYVTGYSNTRSFYNHDYTTIKYNSSGQEQWIAIYDGTGGEDDEAKAIVVDTDGNVYVTGDCYDEHFSNYCMTIKYDPGGNRVWTAAYHFQFANIGYAIAEDMVLDNAGNVYIAGYHGDERDSEFLVVKYDSFGVEQWAEHISASGGSYDYCHAMTIDADANLYVTGEGFCSTTDYVTIKLDSDGNVEWISSYDGNWGGDDSANDIVVDAEGNVYVTGESEIGAYTYEYATVKYDPNGDEEWVMIYPDNLPDFYSSRASAIAMDNEGSVYVTGNSYVAETNYDFATVKYSQPSGIKDKTVISAEPSKFSIISVYPNPFNPATVISFELQAASWIRLDVFGINGRNVGTVGARLPRPYTSGSGTTPTTGFYPPGMNAITFDGTELTSGIYIYRLTADNVSGSGATPTTASGKIVLIK